VSTGHGNATLAAARRFCEVTGIDYVPAVLEDRRKRAAAEGLLVDFQEGAEGNANLCKGTMAVEALVFQEVPENQQLSFREDVF
jgi:tRNA/tmRNA/rRNA uracil-C5-methylase (TrmA/RlmC/RlmD family)